MAVLHRKVVTKQQQRQLGRGGSWAEAAASDLLVLAMNSLSVPASFKEILSVMSRIPGSNTDCLTSRSSITKSLTDLLVKLEDGVLVALPEDGVIMALPKDVVIMAIP